MNIYFKQSSYQYKHIQQNIYIYVNIKEKQNLTNNYDWIAHPIQPVGGVNTEGIAISLKPVTNVIKGK